MVNNKKQTRGRQKIDTSKRRDTEEDRLVTFSKRRTGLYKKASELCIVCGTELAILIFSASGKPFSFAHPSIEVIAKRFLNSDLQHEESNDDENARFMKARLENKINDLNQRLNQLAIEAEVESERGRKLRQMASARQHKPLCEQNIDKLSDDDAQRLNSWLLDLQMRISYRLQQLANPTYYNAPSGSLISSGHGTVHPNTITFSSGHGTSINHHSVNRVMAASSSHDTINHSVNPSTHYGTIDANVASSSHDYRGTHF